MTVDVQVSASADLLELIQGRRSHLRLAEPGPSKAQLNQILRAAVCAPDHGRLRPWRFTVFAGKDRASFGEILAAAARARDRWISTDRLDTERRRLLRAPVVVSVAAQIASSPISRQEQVAAVAAAVQNMLLAATALGFGSIWRTGAACTDAQVKTSLGLRLDDALLGFVYFGTPPSSATPPRPEPTLDGVVRSWSDAS